jgi:hypothetical protein
MEFSLHAVTVIAENGEALQLGDGGPVPTSKGSESEEEEESLGGQKG